MRVCIVGAGAIGGFIGTRLAATGQAQVSALARGATLAALRTHGWRMRTEAGLEQASLARASDDAVALGPQDLVVVAVKATALGEVAPAIGRLMGPDTRVLTAMNGVPWWFCDGVPGWRGGALESVDPGGRIGQAIPASRVIGGVVHASASTAEPGLVRHAKGQGLIVGDPQGGCDARTQAVAALLSAARFDVTASTDIRRDIWYKLWGNLTFNPISVLTGATGDRILQDPLVREFCSSAMREAAAIGARIGCPIEQSPEERHAVTAKLGAFRTSMLQDAEAGRPIEHDAIVAVVREIGLRVGVPTPSIDALLGLTRVFARTRGLYPG